MLQAIARWRLLSVILFALALGFAPQALTESEATVTVLVSVGGQPADALIRISKEGELIRVAYTDVHTPGEARFELPAGKYTISVEHGAGFTSLPKTLEIAVEEGSPLEVGVALERLFDPRQRGYYSADLHLHTIASAAAMKRDFGIENHGVTPVDQAVGVQLAADLDVMFISDHNSTDGHELLAQTAQQRGVPYVLSEEITTLRWGHFNPYSLRPGELVEFRFDKTPAEFFEEARAKGAAIIQVNHPLTPGMGYFFVRNDPEFDPSFDAVEVLNGSFDESDLETIRQLFRYWNERARYVATAYSDDHDWMELDTQYGTPRTYAFVEGELTAESFIESLKGGHAFVTYGPLVFLRANESAIPGDVVSLSLGEMITLRAEIQSVRPLEGAVAEIVKDGQSVASFELAGREQTISFEDRPDKDGWYLLRILDSQRKYLAMTNPIWVEVHP